MAKNYKEGETLTITDKASKFYGLSGKLISNTPTSNKPLKIDLSPCPIWCFSYDEVSGGKQVVELNYSSSEATKSKSDSVVTSVAESPAKRGYKPRKPKVINQSEPKVKRGYNRKKKSN